MRVTLWNLRLDVTISILFLGGETGDVTEAINFHWRRSSMLSCIVESNIWRKHIWTFKKKNSTSIKNLEVKVGQIANLVSTPITSTLPRNIIPNPKEQFKAIVLRSGKEIGGQEEQHMTDTHNEEQEHEMAKTS